MRFALAKTGIRVTFAVDFCNTTFIFFKKVPLARDFFVLYHLQIYAHTVEEKNHFAIFSLVNLTD